MGDRFVHVANVSAGWGRADFAGVRSEAGKAVGDIVNQITQSMRTLAAQALLDRFIERSEARIFHDGINFAKGTKLGDLPKSYVDDFYQDADAVLAALGLYWLNKTTIRKTSSSQHYDSQGYCDSPGRGY